MKVSLNTVKQYTNVDLSVEELVAKINAQLGGVEEVTNLGERYEGAVIAKVVKCEKHPNADKLSVCEIDAGTGENVQVVCGAPNVREGLFVVWLQPGSTVPSSFSEKEQFVLEARELRGVVSNGMLASSKELAIGDSHDGILEIDPDEWKPTDVAIAPGVSFAEVYGLNDYSIDIENKMFTHRPDLFGQLGVAREIAGIQHKQFASPQWYTNMPEFNTGEGLDLQVTNDANEVVPRFMAVAIKDVTIKASPLWLQIELMRLGSKSINNVVDVTNYVMLLTAQPTHAYDYDKLRGHSLYARMAKQGETAKLLNGKTYTLEETDIVIADGEGPVGLAGIMGGGESEVSSDTKNIVLEVANFDMYAVRKSSMRHGVFTDALTRFNKGQSPLQNSRVLNLLMQSINDVAGGTQASRVFDEASAENAKKEIKTNAGFINERLGLSLEASEIATLLTNVEIDCKVEDSSNELNIVSPFWRTDLELPEDIVEEVGRLYGFDQLPRELPKRTMAPGVLNTELETKQLIRSNLAGAGANEVLTYSFVHEKLLKNAGEDVSQAFKLSNALSPDLQYYRLHVLPSLLDKVHANIKNGFNEFALFEIGKGHQKKLNDEDGLPREIEMVDVVYASKTPKSGAPYYRAQRLITNLASKLGFVVSFQPALTDIPPAFEPARTAVVLVDGRTIGFVGELKVAVRHAFKLPDYTAATTLDFSALHDARLSTQSGYQALSRFPSVTQDISLKVEETIPYSAVLAIANQVVDQLDASLRASINSRSIYQPEVSSQKTITLSVRVTSLERTLTDEDVRVILDQITERAADQVAAVKV